jgi:hypothetical protein
MSNSGCKKGAKATTIPVTSCPGNFLPLLLKTLFTLVATFNNQK